MCSIGNLDVPTMLTALVNTAWIGVTTFHIRLLLFDSFSESCNVDLVMSQAPLRFEFFQQHHIVLEMSRLQDEWFGEMKQLVHTDCC